jgi:hypothetical protein
VFFFFFFFFFFFYWTQCRHTLNVFIVVDIVSTQLTIVNKRAAAKEQIAYEFLLTWKRIPQKDLHWFDEKPLYSNAVPHGSYGEVGVDAQIQKEKSAKVHYSQLTLCNTIYGFKVLKVIQHPKSKLFFPFLQVNYYQPASSRCLFVVVTTEQGTNRLGFVNQCRQYILPEIIKAWEARKGHKVQHLFLDRASIHNDDEWGVIKEVFKPYANVHYLPSVAHDLLSPLDFALFRQQQSYFSFLPNSTPKEVEEAVKTSGGAITVQNVRRAVHEIGYGVRRSAGK